MNDINGYTITETTNEYSRVYTRIFSFQASSEQTTVKVESKRGVPKLKGILKKHNTIVPTVSPFDPWCDGTPVEDLEREDVLDTVLKPICATYRELEAEKLRLSNTPGGIFKNKGIPYAFHIHHCKAVPVDEPITFQWNLQQTEKREVSTLLFARALREDPFYEANIKYYNAHRSYYHQYNCGYRPRGRHIHREGYNCATRYAIKARPYSKSSLWSRSAW
jgi:hypothetical protein